VEDGLLSCTRTRLLNRVEPVPGKALSLISVDVLVQIRPDLRFRLAAPHSRPLYLREGHGLLAPDHLQTLHEKFTVPPDLVHCFLLNGFRRLLRAALLPPGRVRSESSRRSTSRTACDLPARRCNIRSTASCTLDASPNSCTHRQLPRVTARMLAPPARRRSHSCRSSTCTGSSARGLLHRRNHAAPAPVLARRQFTCVAPHQLMPEPFAPTHLRSSPVRSTPAHPFLLCRPAPALAPALRCKQPSARAHESILQRHSNRPRTGSFPPASTPARASGPVRVVRSRPAPALPAHAWPPTCARFAPTRPRAPRLARQPAPLAPLLGHSLLRVCLRAAWAVAEPPSLAAAAPARTRAAPRPPARARASTPAKPRHQPPLRHQLCARARALGASRGCALPTARAPRPRYSRAARPQLGAARLDPAEPSAACLGRQRRERGRGWIGIGN
jgi:hypothetical protein